MIAPQRLIEERLVWFWHDHFATSLAKVRNPYLMWTQHLTIRRHATGNFADLLGAIATDPAMLLYLDGAKSTAAQRNENFGRECLELFTMGRDGGYTQDDVVAASRAFTGWVIDTPGRQSSGLADAPWHAAFVPRRHDDGELTLLGATGPLDMAGALQLILGHPSTARFIAAKLFRELVGLAPEEATLDSLSSSFAADFEILPLVESIVAHPAFTSDAAVRVKYRTPIEKVGALAQATGATSVELGSVRRKASERGGSLAGALRTMSFLPFAPPNVAGFPKGSRLTGPSDLIHGFDLLNALAEPPTELLGAEELFARLGVFDLDERTRTVVDRQPDPIGRLALALTSPEFSSHEPDLAPPLHHRPRRHRRRRRGRRLPVDRLAQRGDRGRHGDPGPADDDDRCRRAGDDHRPPAPRPRRSPRSSAGRPIGRWSCSSSAGATTA